MIGRLAVSPPSPFARRALEVMARYVSTPTARSVLDVALMRESVDISSFGPEHVERVATNVRDGLGLFVAHPTALGECVTALRRLSAERPTSSSLDIVLRAEDDIVRARSEARSMAGRAGFSDVARTRVVTAVSELARNIVRYAGEGTIHLSTTTGGDGRALMEIVATDRGPGIADLETILSGAYRSKHGMGLGLRGVKRIAESFHVQTSADRGTTIRATLEGA